MKEGGAHAVKLEGGAEMAPTIRALVTIGVPVMGHLGLTPQSIYKFGTYVVRAREDEEARKLIHDAHLLEQAGCFAIVLEKVPAALAAKVAKEISIPIIGIGAGGDVDGQVLVLHDMLGINTEFKPRFLRTYLNLQEQIVGAIGTYVSDVKSNDFPNASESY
jgi:3-methyl-2-oxobutanoate hydroxymethyltransferase